MSFLAQSGHREKANGKCPKDAKAACKRSRGHRDSHCGHSFEGDEGYCRHFIEPPKGAADLGACEKVSGAITGFIGAGCLLGRTANKDNCDLDHCRGRGELSQFEGRSLGGTG
jgi:hypothetical protein